MTNADRTSVVDILVYDGDETQTPVKLKRTIRLNPRLSAMSINL
jgi:hypothetical protein